MEENNSLISQEILIGLLLLLGVPIIILNLIEKYHTQIINLLKNTLPLVILEMLGIIVVICVLTYLIVKIIHLVQYLLVRKEITDLNQKEQSIKQNQQKSIATLRLELEKIFSEAKPLLNAKNNIENKQNLEKILEHLLQPRFKDLALHKQKNHYIQLIVNKIKKIEEYLQSKEKELLDKEERKSKELEIEKGYFKGSELSEEDKDFLLSKGFVKLRCNEFSGRGNPVYFLKPRDKETPEHLFLVRHTQEYLEKNKITVTTPEKKDADVIFELNGITYAIEVETGTYPKSKPEEFENKIKQLNEKYKDNWMFLVTKVELISQYKKYNIKTYHREQMIEVLNNETQRNS